MLFGFFAGGRSFFMSLPVWLLEVVDGVGPALRRAVTALVDNALDHAAACVEVRVHRHGREAEVLVLDDGPGIPDEVRPRVFERFTSGRPASARPGGRHYGIGLALVADVAAAHDGTVSAHGRDDGRDGAALSLVLPLRPSGARRSR